MTDPSWPQMERGRPLPADGMWRQPPGQATFARPGADEPVVLDASLVPAVAAPAAQPAPARRCLECGGDVDADGYCQQCGAKAPTEREHFEEAPASWVGAVCDRGVKHARNEDALATAAEDAPGSRAVLVVCDGVTTSEASDVASLAAAGVARDVLSEGRPEKLATPASRNAAVAGLFARAAALANDAVAAHTKAGAENPAACTFVAALIVEDRIWAGNVGDSRAYWLQDDGVGQVLTRDDSMAEENIASGVPRKEAETAADAHTITRWLGIDAADVVPHMASSPVTGPGWVLVCSDGLWNYASEPAALHRVLSDAAAPSADGVVPTPVDVARGMVKWAIRQGGHDNISVALARVGVVPEPPAPAVEPVAEDEPVTARVRPVEAVAAQAAPVDSAEGEAVGQGAER